MKKRTGIILVAVICIFAAILTVFCTATATESTLTIAGRTVFLDSNFGIRYLIEKDAYDAFVQEKGVPAISYRVFAGSIAGQEDETEPLLPYEMTEVTSLSEVTIAEKAYLSFTVAGIAPKDAARKIRIAISFGGEVLDTYEDSLKNAMEDVLSGNNGTSFKAAARSILEYAQAASDYFQGDAAICESDTAFVGLDKFDIVKYEAVGENTVDLIGTSLILRDELSLRFWADAGNYDLTTAKIMINGEDKTSSCDLEKNDGTAGYWAIRYACPVDKMESPVTVVILDSRDRVLSNTYQDSVVSYCAYAVTHADQYPTLAPLAKKILNYIYYTNLYLKNTEPEVPPTRNFTVTFVDWDGTTVLKQQSVAEGESATPPADPTRAGYAFTGWQGNYTNVTQNETVTATYEELPPEPSFEVISANATAGQTNVKVYVNLNDNPGFANTVVNIDYDENALVLTGTKIGSAFATGEYQFVKPMDMSSGCSAAYSGTDVPVPEEEGDYEGQFLILTFTVKQEAAAGNHAVTISCPKGLNVSKNAEEAIQLKSATGYIVVA